MLIPIVNIQEQKITRARLSGKKWLHRPAVRREMPASSFLSPSDRKYPYRDKAGNISSRMLSAAKTRARQHNRPDVYKKAEAIQKRLGLGPFKKE